MNNTKNIFITDYDYGLPDNRIARYPLVPRDSSKLLVYRDGHISENVFSNVAGYIPEKSLLVFNNTKVIQARVVFQKPTGARIEVFCLEPVCPADYAMAFQQTHTVTWLCMVGNLKKWKEDSLHKTVGVNGKDVTLSVELLQSNGLTHHVRFSWDNDITFSELLEAAGELPIPPYLHRDTCREDKETYQTVYSKIEGSVAAPTAGLHFTPDVFKSLHNKQIQTEELTLHVGAGTFHPVKSELIAGHEMHTELFLIKKSLIKNVLQNTGRIFAVGTTSVRTLESLYYIGLQLEENPHTQMHNLKVTQWMPYEENREISIQKALQNIIDYLDASGLDTLEIGTQIMIAPGFKYRVVSGIITNFHQPKSTLLLLVSAFIGNKWKDVYDYALNHDFRFLSYGDSSILFNN